MFILEEQRYVHEDLERLEQGIADRVREEPKHIRDRLNRDHEVSQLLDQIQTQSTNLLNLYKDDGGTRAVELLQLGTGDPFDAFYKQLGEIREHHARYPNEQAENSEQRYRQKAPGEASGRVATIVDTIFLGEEAFGRFFDLNICYESFLNLPNVRRHTYLQYLEYFDNFAPAYCGVKRADKLTDQYFAYVGDLAQYLEDFMRRTRPLEDIDQVLASFDSDFGTLWEKNEIDGWQTEPAINGSETHLSSADATWCKYCEKEFKNDNVYNNHLTGRKHKKAEELWQQRRENSSTDSGNTKATASSATRLKERAVAEREYRVKRLAGAMSTERSDTRVNVERKQGMTKREREQELENLLSMTDASREVVDEGEDDGDDDEKIYNPLKVPLGWDGKPIPFWLYRLHGLGCEFECEICGNYVYKGRRAFEKHFNEARHIYNLKCLGITNPTLFRDITKMDDAQRLWDKMQREKKQSKLDEGNIVQMEDGEGNVMPEKVYYDLQKQGLL